MRRSSTVNHNLSFTGGTPHAVPRVAQLPRPERRGDLQRLPSLPGSPQREPQRRSTASCAWTSTSRRRRSTTTTSLREHGWLRRWRVHQHGDLQPHAADHATERPGPTFYEIGPGRQSVRNPVALAEQVADDATTNRTLGNIQATYSLTDYLTASVNVGTDRTSGNRQTYLPRASAVGAEWNGRARQVNRNLGNNTLQSLLTFAPRISDNQELEVVGGYEYSDFETVSSARKGATSSPTPSASTTLAAAGRWCRRSRGASRAGWCRSSPRQLQLQGPLLPHRCDPPRRIVALRCRQQVGGLPRLLGRLEGQRRKLDAGQGLLQPASARRLRPAG
jgi:hypothetical protein